RVTPQCSELESLAALWILGGAIVLARWRELSKARVAIALLLGTGVLYLLLATRLYGLVVAGIEISPKVCVDLAHSRIGNIRFIPTVELLEDRRLLSTFGVHVFDDGVPVTGTTIPTGPNSLAFLGSSAHFDSNIVLGTTNSPGTPGGASLQLGPQSQVNATTT